MTGKNKKKQPKRGLTPRQKKVVDLMAENGGKTKGEILEKSGYSESTINKPSRVFGSKAIVEAFEKAGLTDEFLVNKHKEHLNAKKIERRDFYLYADSYEDNPQETIEELQEELNRDIPGAKIISISVMGREDNRYLRVRFSIPDYVVQDKSLDKAYKIKGSYTPDIGGLLGEGNVIVGINVNINQ